MDAPVAEGPGKIRGQGPAPGQHGLGGVVEGGPGVLVLLLPAGVPQDAPGAHLVGGPGEDLRRVFRVSILWTEGLLHAAVEGVEGPGHLLHLPGEGLAAGLPVWVLGGHGGSGCPLGQAEGEHQEEDGPHQRLQGQAHVAAAVPAPQHRHGAGQHIDQSCPSLPAVPAQAAEQAGQGKDQAVIGLLPRGQVQGHPGAGPQQASAGHPPPGCPQDAHRRHQAAQGKGGQNLHPGQGHEQRTPQQKQANGLPGREGVQAVQGLRPLGEHHPVAIGRHPGEQDLRDKVHHILPVPPLAPSGDDPRQGAQQHGDGGHEPHPAVGLGVIKGEGHGIG